MGSAERRKRETAETRQRILDAARELFVERGPEATSMRAIADRIEYTPTAIYHHFESKDALLQECCAADFGHLLNHFRRVASVEDPIERLRRIGEAYVDFGIQHPMHYQFMFMTVEWGIEQAATELHYDPNEDAYAFLVSAVADAMAKGRFKPEYNDPHQVAQILWGLVHGMVSLRIARRDPHGFFRDLKASAAIGIDATLRGLARSE